jgi:HK97 family phage major capsid protein
MTLQELRQKKGELAKQADDILNKAKEDGRMDLRAEEDTQFDAIHADIEKLTKQIAREERQADVNASLESSGRRSEPNPTDQRSGQSRPVVGKITERDRAEALRAWMCGGPTGEEPSPEAQDAAKKCGVDFRAKTFTVRMGPPLKPTAWNANGPATSPEDIREWRGKIDEERAALTGLQSSTTTGGYTVADATMQSLEVALLEFGGMRNTSTVIRTATGGPLPIPTTNDTANKGVIIAENVTSTELEMTFGQLVLDAWKYSSKYILASMEFLQDTSINAPEFLGTALGTRIARITNDHFTTGTGSQPNGIVTAATSSGITTATSGVISYDNLVDLVHSVDPAYRVNGQFMLHDTALKILKKIKVLQYSGDTTGAPLWVAGLSSGQPDTLLGYRYTINQSVATIGAGSKSVLFGQLNKYIIRDVRDVTVMRMDELFALLGQVAFLALSRHDGDLLDAGTNPVKYLIQGA